MGLFSKKITDNESVKADELCAFLKEHVNGKCKRLWQDIRDYKDNPLKCVIRPFELYLDVVEATIKNSVDFSEEKWLDAVKYGEEIYPHIFFMEEQTPDFEVLCNVFLEMFDIGGVISKQMFIPKLYHLFQSKMNYIRWTKGLDAKKYGTKERESITAYATQIRPFCQDEDIFSAALWRFTDRIMSGEKAEKVLDEEYATVCKMVGIYNVSEERIMLAEQKIDAMQAATSRLQDSLVLSEERAKTLAELSQNTVRDVQNFCDGELTRAKVKVDNLVQTMNRNHDEFVESQRRAIIADKDEIVNNVIADSQKEISELRKVVDQMVRNARSEILRASRESGDVISKLDAYFQDNERIKDMLADAEMTKQLNDRIDKLMELSERDLTPPPVPVAQPVPAPAQPVYVQRPVPAPGQMPPVGMPGQQPPVSMPGQMPDELSETADMAVTEPTKDVMDFTPSYLLDESIPFGDRYAEAMSRKKQLENQGMHFHHMFDDVITAVIENANPYMIGPSGCGKTYMVQQIALILEMESIDIGYINEEYDILGFMTANGGYSRPNFYRCYKYGKIAFCDELDNGNSRATVKLNSFLSNTSNAAYNFPNGERVMRHPNFRIIAAGNTTGNGADINYNTREKIEESVQQRFTPIFVGYDNEVERSILGTYQDWYEFVVAFRAATNAWSRFTHFSAAGIITTRDVTRIRKYLDNRSFSQEKIIEYEFIQTKDAEYLAFLAKEIAAEIKKSDYSDGCRKLYSIFADRVAEIRSGKDTKRLM